MLTNDGDLNKENCIKTFLNCFKTSWFSTTSVAVNFSEGTSEGNMTWRCKASHKIIPLGLEDTRKRTGPSQYN